MGVQPNSVRLYNVKSESVDPLEIRTFKRFKILSWM